MDKSALEGVQEKGAIEVVDCIAINDRERFEKSAEEKVDCMMELGCCMRTIDLQRSTAEIGFRTHRG